MNWQILHIPEKPEHSKQQSTVDIFASQIEPKLANTLVRKLNQVAALENLRHVKRVRKVAAEGKAQLSVVLCLSRGQDNQLDNIPNDVLELIKEYKLHPFVTKVAKYAASSKEEWEEQCKLWPTSYHPPTYNIDGITGFSEEDSQSILNFMKVAIKLTKSGHLGGQLMLLQSPMPSLDYKTWFQGNLVFTVVNAAVIVDPSIRQVIASASDQTCLWSGPPNKSSLENFNCIRCAEIIPSHHSDATEATCNGPPHLNCMNDDQTGAYSSVSCLHPWGWAGQSPYTKNTLVKCGNSFSWHPLRHAALVAIEYAAARDMQLFPSLEPSESLSSQIHDHLESSSMSLPAKRQKTQLSSDNNMVSDASMNELPSELMRPYLCTGFDIYLVWEPCTMCAMALVHQRIRRIFYAFPNPNAGALGSVHRLQGEKSLNHHYAVFRVLLPKEVLEELITMDSKP